MTAAEVLVATTRTNAELFGMQDRIGTMEEGKLADLLVVQGNPLEDISVLQEDKNLKIIMKDGRMAKNSLQEETR